jgi:hypothetical protein
MTIDKKEVKKMPSLESLSDDVFFSVRKMPLEDLKDLIKQCQEASRFNCSWQSYYMANTIKKFAILCLDLV